MGRNSAFCLFLCVLFLSYILLLFFWSGTESDGDRPLAETPLGKLRGHWMTSRGGRRFQAFSGVPYARPPVGHLTFQAPEPLEPWSGVREAREDGPYCIQYNYMSLEADGARPDVVGQLDCLYLSVYTHHLHGQSPVLVHFHGGGFSVGNGAKITGPQYLMDEDVVIVDVNYRVGIFGFLSFEDKEMPGNQGLKDQVTSLRWVKQNIASFGGDPNSVTLVGESAGGACVYHHTVSPLTKGLFHRGITESGSSYALWAVAPEGLARNFSLELLGHLDCIYTNTRVAVDCIRSRDPRIVAAMLEKYRIWQIDPVVIFGPVLEPEGPGAFLVGPVSRWIHKPVPLLMGMTSAEGLIRTRYFNELRTSYEWYSHSFDRLAPTSLLYFASASHPDNVTRAVREFYFRGNRITEHDWRNLTTMYTDSWFTIAVLDGANKHTGDVYFYYFDYLGEKRNHPGNRATKIDTVVFGASHTEEVKYIWERSSHKNLQGEDLQLSKKLVLIWTHFASHGTPAPAGSGLKWDRWTSRSHRYLLISKSGLQMEEGLAEDRYRFWKSINYRDKYD